MCNTGRMTLKSVRLHQSFKSKMNISINNPCGKLKVLT